MKAYFSSQVGSALKDDDDFFDDEDEDKEDKEEQPAKDWKDDVEKEDLAASEE